MMVYQGQIYRKAGEGGVWEATRPRHESGQDLGHENQWLLGKLGSSIFTRVHERDLEISDRWDAVRDT